MLCYKIQNSALCIIKIKYDLNFVWYLTLKTEILK